MRSSKPRPDPFQVGRAQEQIQPRAVGNTLKAVIDDDYLLFSGPYLPGLIKPLYYYLAIQIYLDGYLNIPEDKVNTFKGTVRMMFQPYGDIDTFYVNADGLDVIDYKVYTSDNITISAAMVQLEDEQALKFRTKTELLADKYYLVEISYRGFMRTDSSEGLFVKTHESTKQTYASTKFEPHYARRMVPCIDQPDAKAIWKVSIIHPKATRAISNGERIKLIERKEWALTKFADSPRMSSYLLAIFVSNFNHHSGATKDGIKVRLFAPNNTILGYRGLLEHSIDRLDYYSKLFEEKPGIKKLDQVVVDLGTSGGMENFGLVSLNEQSMQGDKRLLTVSHEIVHQWIGNDVTPRWWDDIWITEGLATFLAEHLPFMSRVFQLYHSMQTLLEYEQGVDPRRGVLLPLKTDIGWDELRRGKNAVLNYNVYNRGAMFMGMLHAVMGTESFRKSSKELVRRFKNGTVTTRDFIDTFSYFLTGTDKPHNFTRFCRSWIEQAGHPIVNVKTVPGGVEISQDLNVNVERVQPKYRESASYHYKYDVPIFYTTNRNDGNLVWLYMNQDKIVIPIADDETISVDPFGEGIYKVHYDNEWYLQWARVCIEKKCTQDLFFKPCEEFLRVQMSYALETREKVVSACNALDKGFAMRHPNALRIA